MTLVRMTGRAVVSLVLAATMAGAQSAQTGTRSPVPAAARQLVLVVTPGWDTTSGTLRRYVRSSTNAPWRRVGATIPVVVGTNGLAWGADSLGRPSDPHKREGDGRSPANCRR